MSSLYTCTGCGNNFKRKGNFLKHIEKNISCKNLVNLTNMTNTANINLDTITCGSNNQEINDNKIMCNYCSKIFTRKDSLCRHLKSRCKIKKQDDKQKEDIYQQLLAELGELKQLKKDYINLKKDNKNLRKDIAKLKSQSSSGNNTTNNNSNNSSITNNQINNGVINNINIVAHGREDLSKIDRDTILKALKKGYHCVLEATELIHFNDKYPEYKNIYINNISQPYCMVYNGQKWILKDRNEAINDLYSSKYYFVEENFEEFYGQLVGRQKEALKEFIDINDKEINDKKMTEAEINTIRQIKYELKLLLYNKKDKVMPQNEELLLQ